VRGLLVALAAIVLAVLAGAGSILGIVLLVVASIMLLTALVGICPLYTLFGVATRRHAPS
jgi:hypothetical protein